MCESLRSVERKFFGLVRHKFRLDAMIGEHQTPHITTMKHGGGTVMLWGCFSEVGPGRFVKVEDNLTQVARELQFS